LFAISITASLENTNRISTGHIKIENQAKQDEESKTLNVMYKSKEIEDDYLFKKLLSMKIKKLSRYT
jgi:hypothetical protein